MTFNALVFNAIALTVLAVILAWPVPILLARARWPARAPGVALLLWQAIAVAGGLSMIGAPLCLGLAPLGDSLLAALVAGTEAGLTASPVQLPIVSFLALILAAVMAGYLLAHLATTVVRVAAQRRRHLHLLQLLSHPHPSRERTRVIDDDRTLAYCLPQGAGSLTVLSRGLLTTLPADELAAVIAHESAHVAQRHDIVLVAFRAWHQALPWFPVAALAERRVAVLVEMLADDRARSAAGDGAVARAIVLVAESANSSGGDGDADAAGDAGAAGGADAVGNDRIVRPAIRTNADDRPLGLEASVLHERVARIATAKPLGVVSRVAVSALAVAIVAVPTLQLTVPIIG